MSSSTANPVLPMSTGQFSLPPSLRFSGKEEEFPPWKLRFVAYCAAIGLEFIITGDYVVKGKHDATSMKGSLGGDSASEVKNDETEKSKSVGDVKSVEVAEADVVDGDKLVLSADELKRSRVKVYSLLLQAIQETSLMVLIMTKPPGDAEGVWNVLVKRFERKTIANRSAVYDKFMKTVMEEDELVDKYVARLHNLMMVLNTLGQTVPADLFNFVLLKGLPTKYDNLVTSLGLQSLPLEEIITHLIDHQEKERLKEQQEVSSSYEVANYMKNNRMGPNNRVRFNVDGGRPFPQRNFNSRGGGAFNPRFNNSNGGPNNAGPNTRTCWSCQKPGHVSRECPNKKCFNCGRIGHMSAQCRVGGGASGSGNNFPSGGQSALSAVAARNRARELEAEEDEDDDDDSGVSWMLTRPAETHLVKIGPKNYSNSLILDSGCTVDVVNDLRLLTEVEDLKVPIELRVADNSLIILRQAGTLTIKRDDGKKLLFHKVAYHPDLAANLISVNSFTKNGLEVKLGPRSAKVITPSNNKVLLTIPKKGRLYVLRQERKLVSHKLNEGQAYVVQVASIPPSIGTSGGVSMSDVWHYRFGHAGMSGLKRIQDIQAVKGISQEVTFVPMDHDPSAPSRVCPSCAKGKSHRRPFKSRVAPESRATCILERVHSDLCGPIKLATITNKNEVIRSPYGKQQYMGLLIDEFSRRVWIKCLIHKSDMAGEIVAWIRKIERETGLKVKTFHSDGGGEFINDRLKKYFLDNGIQQSATQRHTPQHNGIVERTNRTIIEMTRCLLHHANVPTLLWTYAAEHAVYLRNRLLTRGTSNIA
jgi:uncharacterized protein (DUF2164 family)